MTAFPTPPAGLRQAAEVRRARRTHILVQAAVREALSPDTGPATADGPVVQHRGRQFSGEIADLPAVHDMPTLIHDQVWADLGERMRATDHLLADEARRCNAPTVKATPCTLPVPCPFHPGGRHRLGGAS